ncbi:MAG: geranylgeranyl reductase family protein [Bacteroidales bacterium]|jgi:geranylgeranyl reductase family protein|nr:geranylgeranyl reductase family protein [Bacteroidales bacterium]
MAKEFDVLIIGGGPAGAMTGIELRRKGYSTCIIDKETFPRPKLCAGLLTQKSIDLLAVHCPGLDPSDFVVEQAQTLDFYFQDKKVNSFTIPVKYYLTERTIFDNLLIQYYLKLGGKLLQQVALKTADIDLKKSTVTAGVDKICYKYLVGADGCNGIVCRAAKIRRHDILCLEGNIPRDPLKEKEFRIYFGLAKMGYGWFFPKKEHYCVGMGGEESGKAISNKTARFFQEVQNRQSAQAGDYGLKGAFAPSGRRLNTGKLPKNTLLVGDAAGFTDPVTGEGIYYAMRSAVLAAGAIDASAKRNKRNVAGRYNKSVRPLRQNIRAARFWKRILYYPPIMKTYIEHMEKHTGFAPFYLERVVATGEISYRNFLWVYFTRVRSKVRRTPPKND